MLTSEVDFVFPVLGFTPDKDAWGFADRETLTSVGPWTLKDDLQKDMELIDADGHRWMVRGLRRIGRARPLLRTLFDRLLSQPQSRIEHDLQALPSISLDDVKVRMREMFAVHGGNYGGPDEVAARLDQIDEAKTIGEMLDTFGLDSFMSY